MNKIELQERVEKCFEFAEKELGHSGSFTPMLEIEFIDEQGKKGMMPVVMALGSSFDQKEKFMSGLGLVLGLIKKLGKIKEVNYIIFMCEAYFSIPTKEEYTPELGYKYNAVREDPNRRDGIIVQGLLPDGYCYAKGRELFITRVKGKKHFTFGSEIPMGGAELAGGSESTLNNFYTGFNSAGNNKSPLEDLLLNNGNFDKLSLSQVIESGVSALVKVLGGGKYQAIVKDNLK